jgi:alkylation response protein AidB-like acyl-CoA dehydrogenase
MDLGLSDDQQMLQQFARDFLEKECPESHVREMEVDEQGYSPDLWRKMAEQGWFGLIIPETYGGVGMTFMDLIVLVEEFGRSLLPGPALPTIVSSVALLEAANEEQKQAYLPAIATGERIWTLAFTEPSARFDADGVGLQATRDGDTYVLNGVKLFVRDSHVADNMVVVARTGGSGEEGISLFAVDARSEGIRHNPIATISSDKLTEIRFENVRVPSQNMLGEEGKAWPVFRRIANKATVLEAAYLVGLAQMDFDITLDYTKDRIQFGRPVATFQALQHKAADMATDVDGSRYITYKAAWAVANEEADAEEQVHIAKAWASDASRRVVAQAQQMHGGIGFTKDYRIQLYFRRQKSAEVAWGDADHHREALARALGI